MTASALRQVEAALLAEIEAEVGQGRAVFAVSGWRGRWVLVRDAGADGFTAGRIANRATFRALEGKGRIVVGELVDLDRVAGMTVANGAPWAPHPESGWRLTLPEQTGQSTR